LEKFEKGMEGINADMRLAEQALKSMDLLCGIFPKFWKKSAGFKEDDAVWGDQKVTHKFHLKTSSMFSDYKIIRYLEVAVHHLQVWRFLPVHSWLKLQAMQGKKKWKKTCSK
jgi:hypothetical protein